MTHTLSPATKARMSAAREGRRHTPETRALISAGGNGKLHATPDTIDFAVRMRRAGATYEMIATVTRFSRPGVLRMVQRAEGEP